MIRKIFNTEFNNLIIILTMVLLCCTTRNLYAQDFANNYLFEFMKELKPYGLNMSFRGDTVITKLSKSKPISVQIDKNGRVNHIGFKIFNKAFSASDFDTAMKFIEHFMLKTLANAKDDEINVDMKMSHIALFSNCYTGTMRQVISNIVEAVNDSSNISVQRIASNISVRCQNGDDLIFTLNFPASYELMTGMTKIEAEQSFYEDLISWCANNNYIPLSISANELTKGPNDQYYTLNNSNYLNLEDLKSTSYYIFNQNVYQPVFSKNACDESGYNLFNTDYDFGITASVTQNMYSGKRTFDIPLHQFVRFLRSQGCVFYTGIKIIKSKDMECSVYAVNANLGYHHQFLVTVPISDFEDCNSDIVSIIMYSFVPIHNQEAGRTL